MTRKLLLGALTILLLPLGGVFSVTLVALMLASAALCSPLIILGLAIVGGGKLASKLSEKLFSSEKDHPGWTPAITIIGLNALFITLGLAPAAVIVPVVAAFLTVLLLPTIAIWASFTIAEKTVDKANSIINNRRHNPPTDFGYPVLSTNRENFDNLIIERQVMTPLEPSSPFSAPRGFFDTLNNLQQRTSSWLKNEEVKSNTTPPSIP